MDEQDIDLGNNLMAHIGLQVGDDMDMNSDQK